MRSGDLYSSLTPAWIRLDHGAIEFERISRKDGFASSMSILFSIYTVDMEKETTPSACEKEEKPLAVSQV